MPVLPKHTVTFILAPGGHAGPANRCLARRVQPPLGGRAARAGPGCLSPAPPQGLGLAAAPLGPGQAGSWGQGSGGRGGSGKGYLPGGGAGTRLGSSSCSGSRGRSGSRWGPAAAAAPRAPKRNCRPGPAWPGPGPGGGGSAPGPGLEWAAARGAGVGRKLLRWSQLRCGARRSGLPRPSGGWARLLKGPRRSRLHRSPGGAGRGTRRPVTGAREPGPLTGSLLGPVPPAHTELGGIVTGPGSYSLGSGNRIS